MHNPRIGATGKSRAAGMGDSSAHDPKNAASSAPACPVSGASQGLSPITGAIRPYPCVAHAPLNPSALRRLHPSALNNASASFLINPIYGACQYP